MEFGRIPLAKIGLFVILSCFCAAGMAAQQAPEQKPATSKRASQSPLDRSGKPIRGKASYYHSHFAGRKMADGTRMNPQSNVAASKTLPLGTKAEVTNLQNGKSEVVEIRDRGPYVGGRIVDVSPKVAEKLDIKKQGVAMVEVRPIDVPQKDGTVKSGAGASGTRGSGRQ